ncbi:MAG: hypothetical protein JAY91_15900, partial [Candidatus Thiodiazotropha endolucinida]|nr:hypothetical protein [Candidatus Thiodiazotropha taylori]MCW4242374.1 hypothetical protein [Candidatus Thiodiazotropha taylori]
EICREKVRSGLDVLAFIGVISANSTTLPIVIHQIIREFNSHRYWITEIRAIHPLISVLTDGYLTLLFRLPNIILSKCGDCGQPIQEFNQDCHSSNVATSNHAG